ncbi:LysM domain-containing protein [Colletotrichum plurivorum]|uniref:LysM domain-containing protein n=1 Tax=Colletotrichum plurivorum TaxID=2175906 RepID=A0A8H6K2X2_9PEZI|nr:LysM domain-containing protein [Colletotrichum plurivorum]
METRPSTTGNGDTIVYFHDAFNDGTNRRQIVDLAPERVYLIYNCYYLRDICVNAYNFMKSQRGLYLHPGTEIPSSLFAYDFNTGKDSDKFSEKRRDKSCPGNWKKAHQCPETNQRLPMRHDGEWYTQDLEPGSKNNLIKSKPAAGNQPAESSKLIYTCEEFPAAVFIEGGNGIDDAGPAFTRCAGMHCIGKGESKGEQNWQAIAHGAVRNELLALIKRRKQTYNQFPWVDMNNLKTCVAFFNFIMTNEADGNPAKVISYSDETLAQIENEREIKQGLSSKRSEEKATDQKTRWNLFTYEELMERVKAGRAREVAISSNDSSLASTDASGMGMGMGDLFEHVRWAGDVYDEDSDEDAVEPAHQEKATSAGQPVLRSVSHSTITHLLKRAEAQDIAQARRVVKDAIAKSSKLNAARLAKPLRNSYGKKNSARTAVAKFAVGNSMAVNNSTATPALLEITDEIAEAAALVAEADASGAAGNVTKRAVAGSGSFWMGSIARKGSVPWGNDAGYKVFRNVLDYGAVGDGVTDDTKAIKLAMTDDKRCGERCNGSTTKNAIVYFPPGTYLISTTIPLPYGTQVIGDAINRPTLKAAAEFVGLGVLSTDEYTGEGGTGIDGNDPQYYVNTAKFYRQIRNVIIDVSGTGSDSETACLHYQVAQATSLQNVELVAAPGSKQIGMYAENGSGGQISDVTFRGGATGIYGGYLGLGLDLEVHHYEERRRGFKLVSDDGSGNIGSVSIMDSSFSNVGTAAVLIGPPSSKPGSSSTGVVFEKVEMSGVAAAVKDTSGNVLLGSAGTIDHWVLGPVYGGSVTARSFSNGGKVGDYRRSSVLVDSDGKYFEKERPQYEDRGVGDFVHLKDLGAAGDGSTDDTAAFQAALYSSQGKILFVDAGSYIFTSTVTVPIGTKMVGETWSHNPKVMLKVGNAGDVGDIEMQDLIFTNRGPTAGLILVEWNVEASTPGSAGLWDCHVRIGGATGTELTPAECPPVTSGINSGCNAASLMFHLTTSGSGYFENMWLWLGDHMIDDPDLTSSKNDMVQTSIYAARGFLIESRKSTWLYATASEHAVFYQYNFHKAKNIFAGMLQTESPYYQPTPPPPAPFEAVVGKFVGDPEYNCASGGDFSGCDESWAVIVRESENIFVGGAGIYSWFSTYSQDCIDVHACQKTLLLLESNKASVRFQNLITIGAKHMAVMDGQGILAADNLNVDTHPSWSQISILDVSSSGAQFDNMVWIDPAIWKMDKPQFTCSPPCHVKIPPWTGATSTVNYPLLTVVFKPVTLTQGANGKFKLQNAGAPLWPEPAVTPSWPAVVYNGPDGSPTTTAPTASFPAPPSSVGPDAAPPPTGTWPRRWIQPMFGPEDSPLVPDCSYFDFDCYDEMKPWLYGGLGGDDNSDWDFDENWADATSTCGGGTTTSSSTSTTKSSTKTTSTTSTQTVEETPASSPLAEGNPTENKLKCYNGGAKTEHNRLDGAAADFCNGLGHAGDVLKPGFVKTRTFQHNFNGGVGIINIKIRFEIEDGCEWKWDYGECRHYLTIPVDSCNCSGVNNKQGGVVSNSCYTWTIDPNLL